MTIDELKRLAERNLQLSKGYSASDPQDVFVLREDRPTEILASVYDPVFCLILQGSKETRFATGKVPLCAGDALVVSHTTPVLSRITEASRAKPYLALILRLDLSVLRGLHEDAAHLFVPVRGATTIEAGQPDQNLLDALGRLLALEPGSTAAKVLTPLYLREIHFHLLSSALGGALCDLVSPASHGSRIARAIGAIKEDTARNLPLGDLAQIAGMSVSSFHQHFKEVTGETPLRFQKDLRLIEAQRLLTEGGRRVAEAAHVVGYESAAQFSRDYRRRFGTTPSEDRLRALGPAAA